MPGPSSAPGVMEALGSRSSFGEGPRPGAGGGGEGPAVGPADRPGVHAAGGGATSATGSLETGSVGIASRLAAVFATCSTRRRTSW